MNFVKYEIEFLKAYDTLCVFLLNNLGFPVKTADRSGSQLLGVNGRDDGALVSFLVSVPYDIFLLTEHFWKGFSMRRK